MHRQYINRTLLQGVKLSSRRKIVFDTLRRSVSNGSTWNTSQLPVLSHHAQLARPRWYSQTPNGKEPADSTGDAKENQENVKEEGSEPETPEQTSESDAKLAAAEQEIQDTKNQLLRVMAESENVRKRGRKDLEDAKTYAIQSFAKQLLDVADNLQRAIDSVPKEDLASTEASNASLIVLFQGLELTKKELEKAFQKNQVTEVSVLAMSP